MSEEDQMPGLFGELRRAFPQLNSTQCSCLLGIWAIFTY